MLSCIGMSTYLGDIKLLLHFVLYIAKNWLICLDRHMYITNQFQHSLVPERTLYSVLYIAFLVVRLRLCLRFASRLSPSSSLYSSAAPMLLTSSFLFDFTFLFVSYFSCCRLVLAYDTQSHSFSVGFIFPHCLRESGFLYTAYPRRQCPARTETVWATFVFVVLSLLQRLLVLVI